MTNTELQVINAVLKNKDIGVLFGQSVDDLFEAYGDVWESIKSYYNKYHAIPDVEVMQDRFPDLEKISVGGETPHYLDRLREEVIRSNIESILTKAAKNGRHDTASRLLNDLQFELAALNKFSHSARDLNLMDLDAAEKHYDEVRERAEAQGGVPGIHTGIPFIDSAYTSGFAPGDLIVVLGWTGRMKSYFTTLVACNAHSQGYKPMILSLEMSGEKVRDRVYTIMGNGMFSNSSLTLGDVGVDSFRTFKKRYENSTDFIVVTNDGTAEVTPNVVQAKIDQHRPSMVILDYAQLMSDNANSSDMTARMRNMSKEFKRLAVANQIPIVLISSATAESAVSAQTPPTIEQVAWSKQLAFDADLAFAVHKHDYMDVVEIVCRKNRNGSLFAGFLQWDVDRGVWKEEFQSPQ